MTNLQNVTLRRTAHGTAHGTRNDTNPHCSQHYQIEGNWVAMSHLQTVWRVAESDAKSRLITAAAWPRQCTKGRKWGWQAKRTTLVSSLPAAIHFPSGENAIAFTLSLNNEKRCNWTLFLSQISTAPVARPIATKFPQTLNARAVAGAIGVYGAPRRERLVACQNSTSPCSPDEAYTLGLVGCEAQQETVAVCEVKMRYHVPGRVLPVLAWECSSVLPMCQMSIKGFSQTVCYSRHTKFKFKKVLCLQSVTSMCTCSRLRGVVWASSPCTLPETCRTQTALLHLCNIITR